jgi:hypothetical protein
MIAAVPRRCRRQFPRHHCPTFEPVHPSPAKPPRALRGIEPGRPRTGTESQSNHAVQTLPSGVSRSSWAGPAVPSTANSCTLGFGLETEPYMPIGRAWRYACVDVLCMRSVRGGRAQIGSSVRAVIGLTAAHSTIRWRLAWRRRKMLRGRSGAWSGSNLMLDVLARSRAIAMRASRRARGAPMQKCRPRPKAK